MPTKPIQYVDYDFDALLLQLQNRLALKDAWKDMYRSATGSMLIELFAAVGTLVLYYVERRAEESYIGTARNLSSVINLARLLNYVPKRNVSAIGTLRFSLDAPATSMVFIPKGTNVSTSSGTNYLVSNDGVIMPGQSHVDVTAMQGSLVPITFVSTGSTNQEYTIPDTQVENTNITVTVNGLPWTKRTSFINSTNVSTDYVIRPELNQTITVVFGNGVFGKSPALGDVILVTYVKSLGLAGNVYTTGSVTVLSSTIHDQYGAVVTPTVTNTTTFLGGDDAEDIEDIRNNAPAVFATGDRLVTKSDFAAVIKDYPSVADANAWGENEEANPDYSHFNQVKVAIVLQNWNLPSTTFEEALSAYLYTKSLMTVRYSYVDPTVLEIVPTMIIKVVPGASLSYVQSLIEEAVRGEFTLGTTTKLGLSHRESDMTALIEAVPGVAYSHLVYKIRKELTSAYDSTYNWAGVMDIVPAMIGGVEVYIDDTKIASDNGSGGWTRVDSAYTISGMLDYDTGFVGINISPAPDPTSHVYCRYRTNQNGDIVVSQNQICRWVGSDYTSISYAQ